MANNLPFMKKLSGRYVANGFLFTFLTLWLTVTTLAQQPTFNLPKSKYGLPVVSDAGIYQKIVAADPDNELVDMRQVLPEAKFDVTYADTTNFLKRKLYPSADVFMRKPAAMAIRQAHENLKKKGLGLLLFDGYRPYAITVLFYEEHPDTTFVADPRKGSRHNRGMAIDLTLYELKTGKRLSMPSDYDESTPRAYHNYTQSDSASLAHRAILRSAMEEVGFAIFPFEWWHYDFRGWEKCFTYDLSFEAIRQVNKKRK